jgi:cytochrome c556
MVDIYEQSVGMDECRSAADEFRGWLDESLAASKRLAEALRSFEQGDQAGSDVAKQEVAVLKKLCANCHGAYRNSGS